MEKPWERIEAADLDPLQGIIWGESAAIQDMFAPFVPLASLASDQFLVNGTA
jgi:hypothetical protein